MGCAGEGRRGGLCGAIWLVGKMVAREEGGVGENKAPIGAETLIEGAPQGPLLYVRNPSRFFRGASAMPISYPRGRQVGHLSN